MKDELVPVFYDISRGTQLACIDGRSVAWPFGAIHAVFDQGYRLSWEQIYEGLAVLEDHR